MYLALDRGRPGFPQDLRVPWYSGILQRRIRFRVHDFHALWSAIPDSSAILISPRCRSYNPPPFGGVWTLPLSLAATDGISFDFFSSSYLDVSVQMVPHRLLSPGLAAGSWQQVLPYGRGFPIRKPPDRRIMAPPRRLSRSYTSFLGTHTLGIHCQL